MDTWDTSRCIRTYLPTWPLIGSEGEDSIRSVVLTNPKEGNLSSRSQIDKYGIWAHGNRLFCGRKFGVSVPDKRQWVLN